MQLRPQLSPGQPGPSPAHDPVEAIAAHRLWLGFFLDRLEVKTLRGFVKIVCALVMHG